MSNERLMETGYFRLAKNISKFSDHRVRVGAVIAKKKPVGAASNKAKTHPRFANPYNSLRNSIHAEIRAIINCGMDNIKGSYIYVYRQHKNGTPAFARPCPNCLTILKEYGIRKVYFTTEEFPYYQEERL